MKVLTQSSQKLCLNNSSSHKDVFLHNVLASNIMFSSNEKFILLCLRFKYFNEDC